MGREGKSLPSLHAASLLLLTHMMCRRFCAPQGPSNPGRRPGSSTRSKRAARERWGALLPSGPWGASEGGGGRSGCVGVWERDPRLPAEPFGSVIS
jgi:hypothetical protein